jgi:hypothetical protein
MDKKESIFGMPFVPVTETGADYTFVGKSVLVLLAIGRSVMFWVWLGLEVV